MNFTYLSVSRFVGALLLFQGVVLVFFGKVLHYALSLGLARYNNMSGKLARNLFSSDQQLASLLELGQNLLPFVWVLAFVVILKGILAFAFPLQTAQILKAFGVLREPRS